jgi:hypothetical protein
MIHTLLKKLPRDAQLELKHRGVLTAYYDLRRNPPSFNVVDFLCVAEMHRIEYGLERIEVRLLPGSYDGVACATYPPYGQRTRDVWTQNIVMPMARLLPSCGAAAQWFDENEPVGECNFGRDAWWVGIDKLGKAATAGCYPLRADPQVVQDYRQAFGDYFVTLTMREVPWSMHRNTDLARWTEIARRLRDLGIRPVIVRDAMYADEPVPGFDTAPAASKNSFNRAGLYGAAALNVFVPSGPLHLSWFMGAPTLLFRVECGIEVVSDFRSIGVWRPNCFPNARPGQRFVHDDSDDPELVVRETLATLESLQPAALAATA